jgi:hypothetical protein
LVIRVSRDPAENTKTSPLGFALEVADAEEEGVLLEVVELEDELLQPATAMPVQAMASRATTGALFLPRGRIIPAT